MSKAGKTTLVGHLMNTIDPNRLTAVKLVSTGRGRRSAAPAEQFGIEWEGQSKAELPRDGAHRQQARAGRRTLLIVDEGQKAISALEELRMLSNFQLGGHCFADLPARPARVPPDVSFADVEITCAGGDRDVPSRPDGFEEVEPYILHRLGKVGWTGNLSFSPDSF